MGDAGAVVQASMSMGEKVMEIAHQETWNRKNLDFQKLTEEEGLANFVFVVTQSKL